MFRAFCSLVLCCVFSSVGVAQQAQVSPNPVRVQTSATWEYGTLIYANRITGREYGTLMHDPHPPGAIWLSADSSAAQMAEGVRAGGVLRACLCSAHPDHPDHPSTIAARGAPTSACLVHRRRALTLAFCGVGAMSVGMFYLPSALLLLAGATMKSAPHAA